MAFSSTKDALKRDKGALVDALGECGKQVDAAGRCHCPFHEHKDKKDGGILQSNDGNWLFHCHVCDDTWDVFAVLAHARNCDVKDVLPKDGSKPAKRQFRQKPPLARPESNGFKGSRNWQQIEKLIAQKGTLENHYRYFDRTGEVVLLNVARIRSNTAKGKDGAPAKEFFQFQGDDDHGFEVGAPKDIALPLYQWPAFADSPTVVVVEGEKCVDALLELSITATTSPGGSNGAKKADWEALSGKDLVVVWPDKDEPGEKYGKAVIEALENLEDPPRKILLVDTSELDLPKGGDVVDVIKSATENVRKTVIDVINRAKAVGVLAQFDRYLQKHFDGEMRPLTLPWPCANDIIKAFRPGDIVFLGGDPGSTKSFLLVQLTAHWISMGHKVAISMLEDGREFHLMRALAQKTGIPELTDPEYVERHPEIATAKRFEHERFLEKMGRSIHERSEGEECSMEYLAEWVVDRARKGHRVIAIDPFSLADIKGEIWKEHPAFIRAVEPSLRAYDSTLILVTHPKGGQGGNQTRNDKKKDDNSVAAYQGKMAGGATLQRAGHTILWLEYMREARTGFINEFGARNPEPQKFNRVLVVSKHRKGKGQGTKFACFFDPKTLQLECLGELAAIQ